MAAKGSGHGRVKEIAQEVGCNEHTPTDIHPACGSHLSLPSGALVARKSLVNQVAPRVLS